MQILTGFHAIEEKIKSLQGTKGVTLFFAKQGSKNFGPRIKKILALAKDLQIKSEEAGDSLLNRLTENLSEQGRDHRGLVLKLENASSTNEVSLDTFLKNVSADTEKSLVVILDSVTDPHNVGAIFRSCDQFGASLVIIPSQGSAKNSDIITRSSAGASNWIPCAVVTNLVRATEKLKEAGYWIYGADARGENLSKVKFPNKTAIIMGSEGKGIARLLKENCDSLLSIPTVGKIDSLNVSVAAGIFLYEISKSF